MLSHKNNRSQTEVGGEGLWHTGVAAKSTDGRALTEGGTAVPASIRRGLSRCSLAVNQG